MLVHSLMRSASISSDSASHIIIFHVHAAAAAAALPVAGKTKTVPKNPPSPSTAKSNQRAMLCSIANVSARVFCIRKQQHIVADKTSGEYGIACWNRVFFVWQKGAADARDFYWYVFFVVVCFR